MDPVLVAALIVLLESLCFTLTLPVVNYYTQALGGDALWTGMMFVAMSAPKLLTNPLWGAASDRVGRRAVLAVNTLGTLCGSIGWATAPSVGWLLGSRLFLGVFGGQATLAQSVAADASAPEKRAAAMGLLGAAFAVALTVGPFAGGWIAHEWSYAAVGWVCAALQAGSLALILLVLPEAPGDKSEESVSTSGARPEPVDASCELAAASDGPLLARAAILQLLGTTLMVALVLSVLTSTLGLVLEHQYGFDTRHTGYAWAMFGLVGALAQGGLVRVAAARFNERAMTVSGLLATALGAIILAMQPRIEVVLLGIVVLSLGVSFAVPAVTSLLSRCAEAKRQGEALGYNQGATGLGRALGAGLGGWLYDVGRPPGPWLPYFVSTILTVATVVWFARGTGRTNPPPRR